MRPLLLPVNENSRLAPVQFGRAEKTSTMPETPSAVQPALKRSAVRIYGLTLQTTGRKRRTTIIFLTVCKFSVRFPTRWHAISSDHAEMRPGEYETDDDPPWDALQDTPRTFF